MARIVTTALATVLITMGWLWPSSALAALKCQTVEEHQVCLELAKRSAKYFWQYRAVVSVDGASLPLQPYDCRVRASADIDAPPRQAMAGSGTGSPSTRPGPSAMDLQGFVCRAVQPQR